MPRAGFCFGFRCAVWLQPVAVSAKCLVVFSLCEDVLSVKEVALIEDTGGIGGACVGAFGWT